jgi:ribosomal protein S18 acetylase RimI-like enzyme
MWVSEDDHWRIRLLERHGFTLEEEHLILLQRVLADPLPVHELPAGYTLRHSRGISDALLRSEASAAAFKSSKPWDEYLARTMRFIQSPVYVPENEILLTAPDGRVASFCIVWTDPLSKIGLFEPVGTHPDFQGKGLGKYLMFGGLNRLKSQGMNEATVCVDSDNPAGIRLYESVGFRKVKSLLSYKKSRE